MVMCGDNNSNYSADVSLKGMNFATNYHERFLMRFSLTEDSWVLNGVYKAGDVIRLPEN